MELVSENSSSVSVSRVISCLAPLLIFMSNESANAAEANPP